MGVGRLGTLILQGALGTGSTLCPEPRIPAYLFWTLLLCQSEQGYFPLRVVSVVSPGEWGYDNNRHLALISFFQLSLDGEVEGFTQGYAAFKGETGFKPWHSDPIVSTHLSYAAVAQVEDPFYLGPAEILEPHGTEQREASPEALFQTLLTYNSLESPLDPQAGVVSHSCIPGRCPTAPSGPHLSTSLACFFLL